jgi:hypothetical protein
VKGSQKPKKNEDPVCDKWKMWRWFRRVESEEVKGRAIPLQALRVPGG